MSLTVGQLRKVLADLPDDMPVLIETETGVSDEPNFYVIPAHIEHNTYGSHIWDGHREPATGFAAELDAKYNRRTENTTALLLSQWGRDDGVDITPDSRPSVVDGSVAPFELEAKQ